MLVSRLAIALDCVEHSHLWLTERVEGYTLAELPLLILELVLNLVTALKPCLFLLFVLLEKIGALRLELFLTRLLCGEVRIKLLVNANPFLNLSVKLIDLRLMHLFQLSHLVLHTVDLALHVEVELVDVLCATKTII